MMQYLPSKCGVDFLELYYHCRHCIHQKQNIPFLFYVYLLHLTSTQSYRVCAPLPAFSFGLSLTPLPCIPVTTLHVRKVCQFLHVLAELRFCCFSSDTLSLSLNRAMNIGRCLVILFPLRHLDFFEMVRNEDDLELAKRFDLVSFSL